jgi:hypothetical protein
LPFSAVKNGAAGSLSLQQGLRKTCGTFPGTIWKPSKDSGSTRWSFLVPLAIRTWKEQYDTVIELRHTTEHIRELIQGERLRLKSLGPLRIAYHDSCDLGRHGGVYDAPRKIIQSIPGVTLVELEHNRAGSLCCGGGGNLEMAAPELAGNLAKANDRRDSAKRSRRGCHSLPAMCANHCNECETAETRPEGHGHH